MDHLAASGLQEGRRLGFNATADQIRSVTFLGEEREKLLNAFAYSEVVGTDVANLGQADVRRLFAFAPELCPVLVLGDSHAAFWSSWAVVKAGFVAAPFVCFAGSAQGLSNPRSLSGYGGRIETLLRTVVSSGKPPSAVVFKFGQVDLEFIWSFRRLASRAWAFSSEDYKNFIAETARRYAAFLVRMRDVLPPGSLMLVQDVFPPSLSDEHLQQGYRNGHISSLHGGGVDLEGLYRLEYPDLAARTRFHAHFNDRLGRELQDVGVERLEDFDLYLGEDGVINPACISEQRGRDHHMDFRTCEMAPKVRAACRRLSKLINHSL